MCDIVSIPCPRCGEKLVHKTVDYLIDVDYGELENKVLNICKACINYPDFLVLCYGGKSCTKCTRRPEFSQGTITGRFIMS